MQKTKAAGIILCILGVALGLALIIFANKASYEYRNQIYSYWSLSTKASTLPAKAAYFDQFVAAIQNAHLSGNDALFLKTPDNSYEQNFATLQSAQQRFHEVQSMDPTSFQYSQTLSQIAAAGHGTLPVFEGLWYLKHYPYLWHWFLTADIIAAFLIFFAGFLMVLFPFLRAQDKKSAAQAGKTV